MRVKFLKDHLGDKIGSEEDVPEPLANYLIRVKVAEEVKEVEEVAEKVEQQPVKEKAENKTGNVPTAKKKKK